MNIKKLLKQHILTILCATAIIILLLPFFSVTAEMNSAFVSGESSTTVTGLDAIKEVLLGWGLIVGPVLLVAMNYIKQLEKYKGLLAIIVPIVCIIIEIITYFQAKGISASASGGNGLVSVEVKTTLGIGFFALICVYIAMIVAGAVLFHNFTLDKAGLERLKAEGADFFNNGIDKIKSKGESTNSNTFEDEKDTNTSSSARADNAVPKTARKSINHDKMQETLNLIEKLASMKENGILTEEEFSTKKKQLLEEI